MTRMPTKESLKSENLVFRGRGGVSAENRGLGFIPAFRDARTGRVYRSRFRDGSPAPFHLLDGLPRQVVVPQSGSGAVTQDEPRVISGFLRQGRFFSREQAAAWMSRRGA
jgi:hypothetical protein